VDHNAEITTEKAEEFQGNLDDDDEDDIMTSTMQTSSKNEEVE
jgi:flagellar basal body-associated protein FliL